MAVQGWAPSPSPFLRLRREVSGEGVLSRERESDECDEDFGGDAAWRREGGGEEDKADGDIPAAKLGGEE